MADLGHYDNHPGYRYQALYVAKTMKFGRDRSNVPNMELEAGRGGPWFPGGLPITLIDAGVNPTGAIYEPLTDDVIGAGLADSDLDQASFDAVRFGINTVGFTIAVYQSTQTDLRGFLASVLEYFDGFLIRKGTQISLGYWSTGAINTTALPVLGSSDLVGEPRLHPNGWDDCVTEVNVIYKDRNQYYHDTLASVRNSGLQQVLDEYRPVYLQRPFLIDAAYANTYATQYLQRFARPGISGDADFKLDSIEAIEDSTGKPIVGQRVRLDLAAIGEEIVVRVLECEYPGDEGPFFCTLTLDLERSIWPTVFVQPPPGKIGNFVVGLPNIVNHKIVELPSGLKKSVDLQIAILAQRPAKSIIGFHVWDSTDNVTFVEQPYPSVFGAYGTLAQAYGVTAKDDEGRTFHVTLLGVDLLPDTVKQDKYAFTCLVFVDTEIMAIGAWSAIGGGIYSISTLRGLYGTDILSHAVGAKAYFINRTDLLAMGDKNFKIGVPEYFKLQPFDDRQDFDLAAVTSFPYTFTGGAVVQLDAPSLTTAYTITSDNKVDSRITATWTFPTDQDIVSFNVSYRKATWDSQFVTINNGFLTTWKSPPVDPNAAHQVKVQAVNSLGEVGPFSPIATITTASPPAPAAPTGMILTPLVSSVQIEWTESASTDGVRGTQILYSEISGLDTNLHLIDEVPRGTSIYIKGLSGSGAQWGLQFFALRAVLAVTSVTGDDIFGAHCPAFGVQPLTDAPVVKLPPPFVAKSTHETSALGTADYRVQIVNTSAGQAAAIYFSYDKITWTLYSPTGNYRDGITGSVLPTTNDGEISLSLGGQIFAQQRQTGFLNSDTTPGIFNNSSNTPHDDGSGGGVGGGGSPGREYPH